jgi:hypothetical protein
VAFLRKPFNDELFIKAALSAQLSPLDRGPMGVRDIRSL